MNIKKVAVIIVVSAIVVSVLTASVVFGIRKKSQTDKALAEDGIHDKGPSDLLVHTREEVVARYHHALRNVTGTNVHPLLRPVHFTIGTIFAASGTLVLNKQGEPSYVVTAAHLFSENRPGADYYSYRVLTPTGFSVEGDIERVTVDSFRNDDTPDGIQDIALCYIGKPTLIPRVSKVRVSAQKEHVAEYRVSKTPTVIATSVTTGEQFSIVGELLGDHGALFHVMLYEAVNGESGSGYWGNDGRLYVLSGNVMIDQNMRDTLGIPDSFRYASTLTGTTVNW